MRWHHSCVTASDFSTVHLNIEVLLIWRLTDCLSSFPCCFPPWRTHTLSQQTFRAKILSNLLILCNFYFAHPADHGEESAVWFCDTKCVLGVCGLPTRIVFGTEGLWGVPITYNKDKNHLENNHNYPKIFRCFIIHDALFKNKKCFLSTYL